MTTLGRASQTATLSAVLVPHLQIIHQENNTFLGWLETLESARVARDTRSSFKILEKNL